MPSEELAIYAYRVRASARCRRPRHVGAPLWRARVALAGESSAATAPRGATHGRSLVVRRLWHTLPRDGWRRRGRRRGAAARPIGASLDTADQSATKLAPGVRDRLYWRFPWLLDSSPVPPQCLALALPRDTPQLGAIGLAL